MNPEVLGLNPGHFLFYKIHLIVMQSHVSMNNHDLVALIQIREINFKVNHRGQFQLSCPNTYLSTLDGEDLKIVKVVDLDIISRWQHKNKVFMSRE